MRNGLIKDIELMEEAYSQQEWWALFSAHVYLTVLEKSNQVSYRTDWPKELTLLASPSVR